MRRYRVYTCPHCLGPMVEIGNGMVQCDGEKHCEFIGYPNECIIDEMVVIFDDKEPCNHTGCMNHVTHPCEACGRIQASGIMEMRVDEYNRVKSI